MDGFEKAIKLYGRLTIKGENWLYDWVNESCRKEDDMTEKEIADSKRKNWENLKKIAK